MFGFKFVKFSPNDYVLRYRNGNVVKEGLGLSFFYYSPNTSLVSIPIGSIEAPFIFEETTSDYQNVTIQGQVTYKVAEPAKITKYLNYTLSNNNYSYISEDPSKLSARIVNTVQVLTKKEIQNLSIKEALKASETLVDTILNGLRENSEISQLGVEILGFAILALKPNAETARALEATTREKVLKEADDAIYERRNSSVEKERKIKENELNTEIAVENKKREIMEAQMKAKQSEQEKEHELNKAEMLFSISQEEEKKKLVELAVANAREEADAKAYEMAELMKAFKGADSNVVQALSSTGMKPQQLIALAFQGLAQNADKIGELNISPDLLNELTKN